MITEIRKLSGLISFFLVLLALLHSNNSLHGDFFAVQAEAAPFFKEAENIPSGTILLANRDAKSEFKDCSECPTMIVVPSGYFRVIQPKQRTSDSNDVFAVSSSFAISKFEVTVKEFSIFVDTTTYPEGEECIRIDGGKPFAQAGASWVNPGFYQSKDHPVVCVNWNDAIRYVNWLSQKTGKKYSLPSEVEWEYVARGGKTTPHWVGEPQDSFCSYDYNSTDRKASTKTHSDNTKCAAAAYTTTGRFGPNAFGIHGMLNGNLEWVKDCWSPAISSTANAPNQQKENDCDYRVARGSSWLKQSVNPRTAARSGLMSDNRFSKLSFRVARRID